MGKFKFRQMCPTPLQIRLNTANNVMTMLSIIDHVHLKDNMLTYDQTDPYHKCHVYGIMLHAVFYFLFFIFFLFIYFNLFRCWFFLVVFVLLFLLFR